MRSRGKNKLNEGERQGMNERFDRVCFSGNMKYLVAQPRPAVALT